MTAERHSNDFGALILELVAKAPKFQPEQLDRVSTILKAGVTK